MNNDHGCRWDTFFNTLKYQVILKVMHTDEKFRSLRLKTLNKNYKNSDALIENTTKISVENVES